MLNGLMATADAAAGTVVMGSLESVVLIVGIALGLRLLPRLSAAARSVVWTASLILVVLLPFLPSLLRTPGVGSSAVVAMQVNATWGLALVCFWATLSVWRACALVASAIRLRSTARRAVPVDGGAVCREVLRGDRRSAELCVSADVDRPSVAGFFQPRVLLPTALFASLDAADLEQIVRHEMEHLRRRDDWTNLLQKLSLVIFPLNPVMVWLDRRMSLERELACDDSVLRQTRARKAYAACLTNLAERSLKSPMVRRGASLALGAWGRQTELAQRVHRILTWREARMGRRSAAAVTGALLLGVTAGTTMLARSPQLVRFSAAEPITLAANLEVPPALRIPSWMDTSAAHMNFAAQPRLIKAVMPEPRTGAARMRLVRATARRHSRHVTPGSVIARVERTRGAFQPWIVLTEWHEMPAPSRLRLAVAEENLLSRYAAVATRDGWVIVKL